MERIISEEERIRRAEEISARRKNRIPINTINTNKKTKISMLSKVFIQVITSICIFGIIYFMNMNNSFAIEKIKPILSEDTDFAGIYNQIDELVKNIGNSINIDANDKQDNVEDESNQNTVVDENFNSENVVDTGNADDTISENNEQGENETQDNTVNLAEIKGQGENSQNENNNEQSENSNNENTNSENNESNNNEDNKILTDVDFIKANSNMIKPINGWITSGYGAREATDIVSANHEGVDIGANFGDEIKAAMSGTVELTSSEGDYGNHLIIANGEISTLYAHCSKIVVKQGDYIEQGQKIAEVGSTGRSTGPHLHFEIRRNNKTVDPQQIVEL